MKLHMRRRKLLLQAAGTEDCEAMAETVAWEPAETAIVVCDMWDRHWCRGASARVDELAPRMNDVLDRARELGIFIIHAPSDTMEFYQDTPQRRRAQQVQTASPPDTLNQWRHLDAVREAPLPIDDSDGGCDDLPQCPTHSPWTRQHPAIRIAPEDAISDRGDEVYNLLRQREITQVIVMGVHTNMCVLGRPFSIRSLVTRGFHVALMRDMTDTMYNSRRSPYVDHFRGTELVIEHIEKFWCPTITSTDFTGRPEFRFKADTA